MSYLSIAVPAQTAVAALPLLARSAIGFGIFGLIITLVLAFKPLLKGLFRALLLTIRPRTTLASGRAAAAALLQRLARDFDATEPGQAAELRWLATRG